MNKNDRPSSPIILASWIAECDQALADAEYLIGRLGRLGAKSSADLTALRVRISALRAQLDLLGESGEVRCR